MTRGIIAIYVLAIVTAAWLGYKWTLEQRFTMTLKQHNEQLKKEIADLKGKEKSYLEAITAKNNRIMVLEKENKNKDTLMSIYQDKVTIKVQKNGRLLRWNAEKLKELPSNSNEIDLPFNFTIW